jgi:hypothetical protein
MRYKPTSEMKTAPTIKELKEHLLSFEEEEC